MGTSEVTAFFVFLIVLFVSLPATTAQRCSNRACGLNEPVIGFPFRLKERQPELCGYPGFDLTCNSRGKTVLKLPFSGEFNVRRIDYKKQEIWINDPNNCLAGRLMSLNLSGSPFGIVYYQYQRLIFLNCSSEYTRNKIRPITCLSNSEFTVFATSSMYLARYVSPPCSVISKVPIPVQSPFYGPDAPSELSGHLVLAWDEPNCGSCEERGGRCTVKNNSTLAIVCSDLPRRGLPRAARYAISVGVGIPALMCLMGLICFICGRFKSYGSRYRGQVTELSFSIVSPRSRVIPGLDGPTIESFPKIVLGESRRIPEPNDNVCPICLSEYRPGETLRSIPECQHCFHTDCIDEWLQLNATCPVCRNSPEKTTSAHAT